MAFSTVISLLGDRERHKEPPSYPQRIQPDWPRMCGASIDQNRIGRTSVNLTPIAFYYLDVGEVVKIIASPRREFGVDSIAVTCPSLPTTSAMIAV